MPNKQRATPSIVRRLLCMLYETLLMAAVALVVVALFLLVTNNRHSPTYDHALQCTLFLVMAAYLIHFWTDSGHTLAMKTWRIKLVQPGHERISLKLATARFMLSWGWFLPALLVCYGFRLTRKTDIAMAIATGIAAWAATALFDPDRQFLHDKLLGTRLISLPKAVRQRAP